MNRFPRRLAPQVKDGKIILELAKIDLRSRYLGSQLGILWAFIQPAIYILILWFVFQMGFKSNPIRNFPFVLWLMSGLAPWFFFSESLTNGTIAVSGNAHLVKMMVFRVGMLPVIKVASALFVHLFFIALLFAAFGLYGYPPDRYSLQVFYYLFAAIALALGLSLITSALIVFVRDTGQAVAVLLQFGFWLTPIFWAPALFPARYQPLIKLNPVYYLTEGYRDSLINKVWFWERPRVTIYFWLVTLLVCGFGAAFFRRMKPHFADVL
jgi:lipopolysaccharide transport system permease protein/teichoic acid transport system permease protein